MKRPLVFVAIMAVIIAAVRCIYFTDGSAAFKLTEQNRDLKAITCGEIYKKTDYESVTSLYLKNCKIKYNDNDYISGNISATIKKEAAADLKTGDVIEGESVVNIPEKSRNDGGFDENMYLFSNGIELKSKITYVNNVCKSNIPIFIFSDYIYNLLSQSYTNISPDHSDILNTVILGNRSDLNNHTKQIYQNTGISHLLSISGLHISLIGMLMFNVLKKMNINIILNTVISAIFIFIYIIISGSSISSVRSAVMFCIFLVSVLFGRRYCIASALSVQIIISLAISPYLLFNQSFLLSYTAVIAIFIGNKLTKHLINNISNDLFFIKNFLKGIFISSFLTVWLLPLQIYFFYQIPLYAILVNIAAIPLAGILIPVSLIAGITGCIYEPLGIFFIGTSDMILNIYDTICNFFLSIPFSVINVGHIDILTVILMYVIIFCLSLYIYANIQSRFKKNYINRLSKVTKIYINTDEYKEFLNDYSFVKNNKVFLFITLSLILLIFVKQGIIDQKITKTKISVLDIGQGDNNVISTESGLHFMFDCGSSNIKNVYHNITEKYLLYNNIKTLDAVFVSHSDSDHVNGIIEMLDGIYNRTTFIKVKNLIMPDIAEAHKDENYKKLVESAYKNNINISYVSKGEKFSGEDYSIDMLWPMDNIGNKAYSEGENTDKSNYLSSVCNVKLKSGSDVLSIMMTGDATVETESKIIKHSEKTDILKVGHHGSKYSSGEKFLKKINPMYSVISCSANNRYNHPNPETIERLKAINSDICLTMLGGQIDIYKKDGKIKTDEHLRN